MTKAIRGCVVLYETVEFGGRTVRHCAFSNSPRAQARLETLAGFSDEHQGHIICVLAFSDLVDKQGAIELSGLLQAIPPGSFNTTSIWDALAELLVDAFEMGAHHSPKQRH